MYDGIFDRRTPASQCATREIIGSSRSVAGAGRDALPRDPRQHVRWSCPVIPASDGRCTPARPASHVWNASVDVRRRTRRNVYTVRGAAPELNHRTSCRGLRGSASLPSPNLIVKPRASSPKRSRSSAQLPQSKTNLFN
jgi:hypothetical protein